MMKNIGSRVRSSSTFSVFRPTLLRPKPYFDFFVTTLLRPFGQTLLRPKLHFDLYFSPPIGTPDLPKCRSTEAEERGTK